MIGRTPTRQRCATALAAVVTACVAVMAPVALAADPSPPTTPSPTPDATPGPLPAVAPWVDGQARVVPMPEVEAVDLHVAGPDRVVAEVSTFHDGGSDRSSSSATYFAAITADGTLGPLHGTPFRLLDGPVFDGRGRGYVLASRGRSFGWATMRPDGQIGALHSLGRRPTLESQLRVDASGNLAIAWIDHATPRTDPATNGSRTRLHVALRPAHGRFRATRILPLRPTYDGTELALAVGGNGRVVVGAAQVPADDRVGLSAWSGTVRTGLGPRQFVGSLSSSSAISAAIDPTGMAVFAAGTQGIGEEVGSGWRVRVASRPAGAARFGPLRQIDPGGPKERVYGTVAIAPQPSGGAVLAWGNRRADGQDDVSVATVDRGGRISSRRVVARGATFLGLDVSAGGTTALSWLGAGGSGRVALRAPGEAQFGAPEPLPSGSNLWGPVRFWPGSEQLVRPVLTSGATPEAPVSLALASRTGTAGS